MKFVWRRDDRGIDFDRKGPEIIADILNAELLGHGGRLFDIAVDQHHGMPGIRVFSEYRKDKLLGRRTASDYGAARQIRGLNLARSIS